MLLCGIDLSLFGKARKCSRNPTSNEARKIYRVSLRRLDMAIIVVAVILPSQTQIDSSQMESPTAQLPAAIMRYARHSKHLFVLAGVKPPRLIGAASWQERRRRSWRSPMKLELAPQCSIRW